LDDLGKLAGGIDCSAVNRFVRRAQREVKSRRELREIETELSKVEGMLPKAPPGVKS
jgi:hypothetical protein